MKGLIFLLFSSLVMFSSCKKDDDDYQFTYQEPEDVDTSNWQDDFTSAGTIPNNTSSDKPIVGTKWVLIKVVTAFATEYPNDTIHFVNASKYTINGGAERGYTLSSIPSSTNYELSFYYFTPFNGSHYSGNVGYYFVEDGEMNNVEFHNIQNTTSTIRAWFKKI